MVVEGWLGRAAALRPAHTALQTPDGAWSYGELLQAARVGAAELAERGAQPGTRVAIALAPGFAFAQALHACMLLGAIAVPLDVRAPAAERALCSAGAVAVIEEPLRLSGRALQWRRAAAHDLDATAVVIHTSGSTSAPRPVLLSYGNILWSALGSAVALGQSENERWLCVLPVAHIAGLSILLRAAIGASTAVVHERFEEDRALDALLHDRVTVVSLVAITLARLLDAGLARPPALRCALTGGGPVSSALIARAREAQVPLSLTYGLTETCSQVSATPLAALPSRRDDAGPPLFCTRVEIEDVAAGGGEGEILVSGPTVARASIARDGWLHTGDLGRLDAEGGLHVTGRRGETIISGGNNVAPAEVEAALEAHGDVAEAAVIGRPDARWGEAVTAIVVCRTGASFDAEQLRAHCARTLAPYKVPKRVLLSTTPLPRTSSGKLLRRELP